jgi:hypothetical protein
MAFLNIKELAQLTEASETPVAFFGDKAMMGIYGLVVFWSK